MKSIKHQQIIQFFIWLFIPVVLILMGVTAIIRPLIDSGAIEDADKTVSSYGFYGKGTLSSPYEISTVNDLAKLRDLVNDGEEFAYTYFKQTEDLDLKEIDNWIPIGVFGSDKYFYGCYDGAGHTLSNLYIDGNLENANLCVGLFGTLYGEVRNLGIESGIIKGSCVGSIASHGGDRAVILNCYNKASVHGDLRAGGIADNFTGQIFFSLNMGNVTCDGDEAAGICSYSPMLIDHCYSFLNPINKNFTGELNYSERIDVSDINSEFIKKFNDDLAAYDFREIDSENLITMEISTNNIYFSDKQSRKSEDTTTLFETFIIIMLILLMTMIIFDFLQNIRKVRNDERQVST